LPIAGQGYRNGNPRSVEDQTFWESFSLDGYHLKIFQNGKARTVISDPAIDVLSSAINRKLTLEEIVVNGSSRLVAQQSGTPVLAYEVRNPQLSQSGTDLAYMRDVHGVGTLNLRPMFESNREEVQLSGTEQNVYEASFLSMEQYAFSASESDQYPKIIWIDKRRVQVEDSITNARYPALSPDGQWLAYSHLDGGYWNLWLKSRTTGASRRIGNVPCNEIQPSWKSDSQTLLYSTDCGRSVWFTALAERRVLP
jgi:hypothetical protein